MIKSLILLGLSIFIITGCSTKAIVKKNILSVQQQKQDAKSAWINLDKSK